MLRPDDQGALLVGDVPDAPFRKVTLSPPPFSNPAPVVFEPPASMSMPSNVRLSEPEWICRTTFPDSPVNASVFEPRPLTRVRAAGEELRGVRTGPDTHRVTRLRGAVRGGEARRMPGRRRTPAAVACRAHEPPFVSIQRFAFEPEDGGGGGVEHAAVEAFSGAAADLLLAASYASTPSAYDVPHERPDTVYDLEAVVPTRTPPL